MLRSEQKDIIRIPNMDCLIETMRRVDEGVVVHTTLGEVLLRASGREVCASYQNGPLVNGSAQAYARRIAKAALEYARGLDLPWSAGTGGHIVIHDPQRYYRDSFRPEVQAAETLLRWELQAVRQRSSGP